MMKSKFENFKSEKFKLNGLEHISGGETTYGPARSTTNGHNGGYDWVRTTYNPEGYPPGTQGTDDVPAR